MWRSPTPKIIEAKLCKSYEDIANMPVYMYERVEYYRQNNPKILLILHYKEENNKAMHINEDIWNKLCISYEKK